MCPGFWPDTGYSLVVLNLCGLTRKEAAVVLGVAERTVKAYQLGTRGSTPAQQALIVSAATGVRVEGLDTEGQKVGVSEVLSGTRAENGPFLVSKRTQKVGLDTPEERAVSKTRWSPVMDRSDAFRQSAFGAEWDFMPDGLARGIPADKGSMRAFYRTPGAYFRLIAELDGTMEVGRRSTKKGWDAVAPQMKALDLPRYAEVGTRVRGALMDDDPLSTAEEKEDRGTGLGLFKGQNGRKG